MILAAITLLALLLTVAGDELADERTLYPEVPPVLVWYPAPEAACEPGPEPADGPVFRQAAEVAWRYFERYGHAGTGMTSATATYPFVTVWDVGSMLAAYHSAYGLGLIDDEDFTSRVSATLATLTEADLYDGAAFNKSYDSRTGRMTGRDERPTTIGYGWSSTDIGRLLIWLRIIERHHPQFEAATRAIVERLDAGRLVRDGYLRGIEIHPRTSEVREYPEGRIGYEQYAAAGFALWGLEAENALDLRRHARVVEVAGQTLLADERGGDRLVSDPFVMYEMELGTRPGEWRSLACAVLAAQEGRYRETGQVTMVSEDALPDPPYYFYYYSVYHDGEPWTVDAQGPMRGVEPPRWVSAKAAYAWNAIYPSAYTRTALSSVSRARASGGWASGIYEGNGGVARSVNVNTNAVILQAALFHQQDGRPLLEHFDRPGRAAEGT